MQGLAKQFHLTIRLNLLTEIARTANMGLR